MSDDLATLEHFIKPQVGDQFHEMFSFWVQVIAIEDGVITVEEYAGNMPARTRVFANWQAWHDAYSYKSMDKPFVRYRDNLLQGGE